MENKYLRFQKLFLTGAVLWAGVVTASSARADESSALRAREFVVMGYQGIEFELRSGEGAYTRTLLDLLNVNPDRKEKALQEIKALIKTYPNIMDFADHVVALQKEEAGISMAAAQVVLPAGPTIYSGDQLENALNHLTRGMSVTVYLKTGGQYNSSFSEYAHKRLWLQKPKRISVHFNDILAIDAPQLARR